MADANPSILSHVSLGTNQFERAVAFYDQVLSTLGCKRLMAHPGAVAYGREHPEFWIHTPLNGQAATIGNGSHIGFFAPDHAAVQAFYAAALAAGATPEGEPGPRPDYGEPYYGCFVRDLDGHKIEAAYWDSASIYELYTEPH
ncbi:VOC family protein [Pseudomonas cavernicola]|uniref:VOC family protein n=1 Tax=Pseudomonas cavernicola TaxID=2320866 RepID=A0A418XI06_9PSED|nr:VOC family protein [Pseudomonas cavernicola]RJG12080.1 VOC family protein [Pseudomonas cavernicola]